MASQLHVFLFLFFTLNICLSFSFIHDNVNYDSLKIQNIISKKSIKLGPVHYGSGTVFRTWAPHADFVWIMSSGFTNGKYVNLESENNGYWSVDITTSTVGDEYSFLIQYQGQNLTRLDPYARNTIQTSSNSYISVVHNDTFDFGNDNYVLPGQFEIVIYEMHVPTFNPTNTSTNVGTFQDVISKLDYLSNLGVNVIELLPIVNFPSGGPRAWGYDPGAPFSIMDAYGGYTGLQNLVKNCHQRGIGVFLDIVWNHLDGNNELNIYDGWSEKESGFPSNGGNPEGIYFYQNENAVTDWGPRPNYGTNQVAQYILDNVQLFLEECHVDGYRWDSVICIRKGEQSCWDQQNENPDGVALLQQATTLTTKFNGFSIAEDLQNDASVTNPVNQGGIGFNAQWSDTSYYKLQDTLGNSNDNTRNIDEFVQVLSGTYSGGGKGSWRVIYTENHDKASGQNQGQGRWPVIVDSANPFSYISQKLSALGIATVLVAPGVPMIFYGQEFLDTENFVFGDVPNIPWTQVGNYANNQWSSFGSYNGFFNMTKTLIDLRRNVGGHSSGLTTLDMNVYYQSQNDLVIAFMRDNVLIVMNLSSTVYSSGYNVGCPNSGTWNVLFNSDLEVYSSVFGNNGAGITTLTTSNTPMHGFNYSITIPLGAYSTFIISQS